VSTELGRQAEQAAAEYAQRLGYTVLAQNWRTRWCEIDLIVKKAQVILFVEVKYRRTASFGGGLDYVTSRKLLQMHFAAEFWLAKHQQQAYHYRLAVAEVSGPAFEVTAWLDDVS